MALVVKAFVEGGRPDDLLPAVHEREVFGAEASATRPDTPPLRPR